MDDETRALLNQLQTQQMYTVRGLANLLQGRPVGADSLEAFLYAIDPTLEGTLELNPTVSQSELDEAKKADS